jgi:hypothetical protein
MKILFSIFFVLSFFSNPFAQIYWGANTTSPLANEAIDIEVDSAGNQYVAGYFTGGTSFSTASTAISTNGNSDIYVAKYSPTGALIWVKKFGGNFSDKPTDLAIDANNQIYITGQYFGQVTFGTTVLNSVSNSKDIFILKLDNLGNVIWAISQGGAGSENAYGITTDNLNNVILTGQFQGSSTIAGQSLSSLIDPTTNSPNFDLFISKYSSTGVPIWLKTGQAKYEEKGFAVACDALNNIYLTGQFSDSLTFAGTTINNAGYNVGFITKISPTGNMIWFNKLKAGGVYAYDVEISNTGEIILSGDFWGNMNYETSNSTTSITNSFPKKIFILKTNNNGQYIWHKTFGSNSDLSSQSLSIDLNGNTYITGFFKCEWSEFHTLGSPNYISAGFKDVYVLKLDSIGNLSFVKQFGGKQNDEGNGIAILPNQTAVVAGGYIENLIIPRSLTNTYTVSWSNFDLTATGGPFLMMTGDQTPNSFITNAIHSATPDFNFFVGQPIDSLLGFIEPTLDTIDFCSSTILYYNTMNNSTIGPDYNYLWNTGSIYDTTIVSATGYYSVIITRKDGCTQGFDTVYAVAHSIPSLPLLTDNIGVAVNSPNYPTYTLCYPDSIEISFSNLCAGCNISIGNPPLFSDTMPHIYNQSGYYFVYVSDSFCSNTNFFQIDLQNPENSDTIQPYLHFLNDYDQNDTIVLCNNQPITIHVYDYFTNPTAILDSFNYQPVVLSNLTSSSTNVSNLSNYSFQVQTNGPGWYVFNYHLTVGFDNTCGMDTTNYYVTDSIYVNINTVEIFGTDLLCPGGSVLLYVDSSLLNFNWFGPGIDWTSLNNDSVLVSYPGYYTFTGTFTDTLNGCVGNLNLDYFLNEKIVPIISMYPSDGILCLGDSALLSLPSGYVAYDWVDPDGFSISNTNSVYVHDEGFYICHITDTTGCTLSTLTVEIIEFEAPNLYADPSSVICDGENIMITVNYSGNANITWINPSWGGSSDMITINQPGIYICEIEQCGINFTDSITILDGSFSVSLTIDDSVLCNNEIATISTLPGYNLYEWSNGNIGGSSLFTSTSGSYSVMVTNQYDCIAFSDTVNVQTIPLSYAPTINDTILCPGANITLSDGYGNTINWYNSNQNLLFTDTSFSLLNLQNDTTILAAYGTLGCPIVFQTIDINIAPPLVGTTIIGDTSICANQSSVFQLSTPLANVLWYLDGIPIGNSPSITVSSGNTTQILSASFSNICFADSASQAILSFPLTSIIVPEDSIIICGNELSTIQANGATNISWNTNLGVFAVDTLLVNSTFGNGYVYVTGIDINNCPTNLDSVWVSTSSIDINLSHSNFNCIGDSAQLNFTSTTNNLVWNGDNFTTTNNFHSFLIDNSTIGWNWVQATDNLGCSAIDSIFLSVSPLPGIVLPFDTIVCLNSWLNSNPSTGGTTYTWQGLNPGDSIPVYGPNWYVLVATNSVGCSVSDSIYIETINCTNSLPNVFSPNGDGVNDYYIIDEAPLFKNNELIVVNRWGNVVYSIKGYQNDWDGGDLVDGVYFVSFVHDWTQSNSIILSTFVHIIR